MSRKKLLEQKRRELQAEVEKWARDNNLVPPGKKLVCSFQWIKVPFVEVSLHDPERGRKTRRTHMPLTQEDWQRILALPWRRTWHAKVVAFARRKRGRILDDDLEKFAEKAGARRGCKAWNVEENLNGPLRHLDLPYRFGEVDKDEDEGGHILRYYQFYKVKFVH